MAFHLTTELLADLPRMSWWARVSRDTGHTHVCHGSAVETGSNFVVEGVWDGPFLEGRFHEAEHFFGSGIYVDENRVWLVPSHALVDRIVYALSGEELVASNSLALLLGYTGARLDPTCDYHKQPPPRLACRCCCYSGSKLHSRSPLAKPGPGL